MKSSNSRFLISIFVVMALFTGGNLIRNLLFTAKDINEISDPKRENMAPPEVGFRGLKWGSPPGELGDVQPYEVEENSIFYPECETAFFKVNEKLKIGRAKVSEIKYYFYKNRLGRIAILGPYGGDFCDLSNALSIKFGKGKEHIDNRISWIRGNTRIELINYFYEDFALTYEYLPLYKKYKECTSIVDKQMKENINQSIRALYKETTDQL